MAFPKALSTFNINTGDDSIPYWSKKIVKDRYGDVELLADEWLDTAKDFIEKISSYIDDIDGINTKITVPDVDFEVPIDLIGLINDIPSNPIKESDYILNIPDELVWNYSEDPYTSDLLLKLQARLKNIIVNGGGALASIEDDIFARETERDALVNEDAKTKAADNWAKRNFELPGVGLFSAITQVDVEYQNKRLDKSRAIAEESRKAEIQMEQNAFAEANKIEATTMDWNSKHNDRKLEAAKAIIQYGLSIITAKLQVLDAKVKAYNLVVQAYVARVEATKAVIDAFTSVTDAKVRYYVAKVQAAIAELDAKVKEMQARAGIIVDADKAQAQIAAQIAAGALAAIHVQASISSGYSAQVSQSESIDDNYNQNETVAS